MLEIYRLQTEMSTELAHLQGIKAPETLKELVKIRLCNKNYVKKLSLF